MVRNIVDGRIVSARTTFTVTIAWLVGVIMAASYMNYRDAGAIATNVANATRRHHAVVAAAPARSTVERTNAYDPRTYPTVASARRTLRAEQLATAPKRYGCLTLPLTVTTASWGPITFACPVGVAYKTFLHDGFVRRTHVGIARTFALHPGVMHLGDDVRYELVPSR